MVHLRETIHSGKYLADQLRAITNKFDITGSIFTVARDNASLNTSMLEHYERRARNGNGFTVEQLWTIQKASGDVRCRAHVINLAVQAAFKSLKADLAKDPNHYRAEDECAQTLTVILPYANAVNALKKLRKYIYCYRNKRQLRDGLERQTIAAKMDLK